MGQTNAKRVQFIPREIVLNPKDDDIQDLAFTGYFQVDDIVDVIDEDANGQVSSILADNLTILAINPGVSMTLSASVDTTAATGTPKIRAQSIDDAQAAMDRLFRRKLTGDVEFILRQDVLAQEIDAPIGGQSILDIDDAAFWRAGDDVDVLADEGLAIGSATVVSVNINADDTNNKSTLVINSNIDLSAFTNPFVLNKTITAQKAILRNQERIDGIDQPTENEFMGIGDGSFTVFEATALFVQSTSKVMIDGRRQRLGTPGTQGTLVEGSGDSQVTFTSMILGEDGNLTEIVVQSGSGFTVAVSGDFKNGYTITVNDNTGAATSEEIADAINADADARRIVLVQWGGDGTGVVATFSATPLTSGAYDGTGDYAELEQVFENAISGTGFKWASLHIRKNERNRLNTPPDDDEELCIDYRKAADNA